MSLHPSMWPARLIDQNFGMCITPSDFILPFFNTYNANYYRPWKWCKQEVMKDFGSTINNERDSFKVTLDVQHFRPNEISVKVANNQILIEGRHEERKDEHGFVTRQFTRRYALPDFCMPEDVVSTLSSDGVLIVTAHKKSAKELMTTEKNVPIKLCKSCPMNEVVTNKDTDFKEKEKNLCQSCPMQEVTKSDVTDVNEKDKTEETRKMDAVKKNNQIMLKEDHCCLLLKPELLRDAATDGTEIKKEKKVEQGQVKTSAQVAKNTSEMLEQTFAKSSAVMSESTESASTDMSTSKELLEQTLEESNTATSSQKVGLSSTTRSEVSEMTSMSSKTTESSKASTSFETSLKSNIKEISDDLSDFVSDILCELEIAQSLKEE